MADEMVVLSTDTEPNPGMPEPNPPSLPDDLPALKRWLAGRPDADRLQPVAIRQILVEADALSCLPDLLDDLDAPLRLLVVQDRTPMWRGPEPLKALVQWVLGQGKRRPEPLVLPAGEDGLVHADMDNAARVRATIGDRPTTVLALGSGTICDLAKHACYLAEREEGARTLLLVVPTAVSVTAFTSSVAVLLKDGVKRSFASRFPDAVVCDLRTLADAPRAMTLAGLGDCCARFVAYGDWYLAHELGLVDTYSETPLHLMGQGLDRAYLAHARAVGAGEPSGMVFLVRQVLLAGLAQSIARMSAPLSGTEHVVSHVLDMGAPAWGRPRALHGAQVGVATPLAARAYELLLETFDPGRPRPLPPSTAAAERAIRDTFGPLDPSGRMAAECWRDYREKLALWTTRAGRFDAVRERWHAEVAPRLRELVRSSATIREILARAGHPLRFEELEPPIPPEQVRFAWATAHLIRQRFTVGDFFAFLGRGGWALADALLTA
jgi:glycerol-1-phosphate dehydrogenase [NAD(P)+]